MVTVCQSGMCEWQPRCIYRLVPGAEEERTPPPNRRDEESVEIERMILRVLSRFPEAKQAVAEEIERMYALESG